MSLLTPGVQRVSISLNLAEQVIKSDRLVNEKASAEQPGSGGS